MTRRSITALFALALALPACGDSEGDSRPDSRPPSHTKEPAAPVAVPPGPPAPPSRPPERTPVVDPEAPLPPNNLLSNADFEAADDASWLVVAKDTFKEGQKAMGPPAPIDAAAKIRGAAGLRLTSDAGYVIQEVPALRSETPYTARAKLRVPGEPGTTALLTMQLFCARTDSESSGLAENFEVRADGEVRELTLDRATFVVNAPQVRGPCYLGLALHPGDGTATVVDIDDVWLGPDSDGPLP